MGRGPGGRGRLLAGVAAFVAAACRLARLDERPLVHCGDRRAAGDARHGDAGARLGLGRGGGSLNGTEREGTTSLRAPRSGDPEAALWQGRLQSPSMDFALRASLWLFKFVPDEFVRASAAKKPRRPWNDVGIYASRAPS